MVMMRLSGLLSASLMAIGLHFCASARLDVIDLPLGFFPEGITNGEEWTAYVGSLANGDIWMGDLETGVGTVMELSAPGPAVGLDYDRRSGYLFVSGGPTGMARIYDKDFELVTDLALATDGAATFINDVIVTKTAAYFTDSNRAQLYKAGWRSCLVFTFYLMGKQTQRILAYVSRVVPFLLLHLCCENKELYTYGIHRVAPSVSSVGSAVCIDSVRSYLLNQVDLERKTGALANGPSTFSTIVLSDNVLITEGTINLNGIEATDDGSMLIVVNRVTQQLFAVDPETGDATLIDLGGELLPGTGSDGLVLRKNTLWVVDNASEQLTEVSLSADLSCGSIAPRVLKNTRFDRPTTAMRKGNSLYAVNAKFDVAEGDRPNTAYEIVRVDRDSGELACNAV
ncbi:unnamed protein product [Pylaiella littoralis]